MPVAIIADVPKQFRYRLGYGFVGPRNRVLGGAQISPQERAVLRKEIRRRPSHCKIQGLCGGVYVAVMPCGRLPNYCGRSLYVGDAEVDVADIP